MYLEELMNLYGTLIQTIFFFFALVIAFLLYFRQAKKEVLARREKSSQYIIRWNSPDFVKAELNLFLGRDLDKISVEQISDVLNLESFQLLHVLNFFEEMAISIDNGLTDEHMLMKYFSRSVSEIFTRSEKFILVLREVRRTEELYRNLERMHGKWSFKYMLSDSRRVSF